MQIAVLSDLHLGRKDRLDRFTRSNAAIEARFVSMLTHLEHHVDKIVLLGDIFETFKGSTLVSTKSELKGALESYPQIARRVTEDRRYQLVFGNHDLVAQHMLSAAEFYDVREDGMNISFFHGHQLDEHRPPRILASRVGVWIGGWLERAGIETTPFDKNPRRDAHVKDSADFAKKAVKLAASRGADVAVTGHTHRAIRTEVGSQLFLNSGTCVAGRREMLLIDTARKHAEVILEPELEIFNEV